VLVVLRFVSPGEGFAAEAAPALAALAARPGYVRGQLTRAYDDPTAWCLVIEWESVGAYRRALSSYEVKLHATPVLARAVPEASAFEPLLTAEPGGPPVFADSDRAAPSDPVPQESRG
jgi:heme oxygenase (mycobilin-producing)